jgi:pilus assembly protein CpaB
MDRRFLTVLGVSLVFALVVSSVFYQMTSRASSGKKPEVGDLKDLVLAARPLNIGTTVKAEDIKVTKVPSTQLPKGSFSKVEDVLDRPVVSNVLLDEPLLEGRLARRGDGVGLAPVIPGGMRAVTVRVNDVVGVAGFVLPGMRVDILITGEPPGRGQRTTKTILQNILVLSAGATTQTDQTGKPVNAPNVTLLVTPQQAENITLAQNGGIIQLILRNGGDQNIEKTDGISMSALYGVPAPKGGGYNSNNNPDDLSGNAEQPRPRSRPQPVVATPPPPPPPPPVVPDQIITIRGIDKKVETVSSRKNEEPGRNP